ncbi:ribonuclease H-like domain-containing protein [Rhizophagus irregularis DAOM 181602=DAOM 197198]|nr:ribonuclease H-like domain-containing protein [Rhizophagus irregularis DAOM 181602=DAOM 197198]
MDSHTGTFNATEIEKVLTLIGPEKFAAVVSDAESAMQMARRLITENTCYTPILSDVEMTTVDLTVTPETSQKKDKQKARVAGDKQVIHQSFTANPEAQTLDKQNTLFWGAKTTAPGVTHILTGYREADDERKQVRDIIVYDILYTWDVEKILGELTICGKTIKLSLKWQHKY